MLFGQPHASFFFKKLNLMFSILHDGSCEFVGRTDDLIKIGGIRAELSEISAALNQVHPEAQEAATLQLSRPEYVLSPFQ
jgi:acyl-coenzyme A synthetase/AMP-(fatty) acid ligase